MIIGIKQKLVDSSTMRITSRLSIHDCLHEALLVLLLRRGVSEENPPPVHHQRLSLQQHVHRRLVGELHKSETLHLSILLTDHIDGLDISKGGESFPQNLLRHAVIESSHKHLVVRMVSLRLLLRRNTLVHVDTLSEEFVFRDPQHVLHTLFSTFSPNPTIRDLNSTNPNPRDSPVSLFRTTVALRTGPNCWT